MTAPRCALATAAAIADLDEEGKILLAALGERGVDARPAVWDDATVDWAVFDLVVVRSTWDYAERLEEFLAWADRVDERSRLLNPPEVLRWNTDKRYLGELAEAGLPVVPTTFSEPGRSFEHPYDDIEHVIKPVVSAGSRDTLRIGPDDQERGVAHAERLLAAGRPVMVQPYLDAVDEHGETALLFVDGEYSHAMRKGPLLTPGMDLTEDLFIAEDMSVREPSAAEREVAEAVLVAIPERFDRPLLYARVDLLPSGDGPQVLELELAEPSLFLDDHPPAAAPFADAIVRRIRDSTAGER